MRPWGPAPWLLPLIKSDPRAVVFVGSLASEDRCTAGPLLAKARGVSVISLLRIEDPKSRFSDVIAERIEANRLILVKRRVELQEQIVHLFGLDQVIADAFEAAMECSGSRHRLEVWLDISALPKRVFFFLVKLAVTHPRVATVVVLYTQPSPGRYTSEHLAEDPEDVRPLPGFGPTGDESETLVVALGFESLGLPLFLAEYRDRRRRVCIFLPFPPGQPYTRRIWETLRAVGIDPVGPDVRRVNALDAFDMYEQLSQLLPLRLAQGKPPALAPYGPKPISIGMCLYALQVGAPVFYTQPRIYHPEYTAGTGQSWAYCLKLDRRRTWL